MYICFNVKFFERNWFDDFVIYEGFCKFFLLLIQQFLLVDVMIEFVDFEDFDNVQQSCVFGGGYGGGFMDEDDEDGYFGGECVQCVFQQMLIFLRFWYGQECRMSYVLCCYILVLVYRVGLEFIRMMYKLQLFYFDCYIFLIDLFFFNSNFIDIMEGFEGDWCVVLQFGIKVLSFFGLRKMMREESMYFGILYGFGN